MNFELSVFTKNDMWWITRPYVTSKFFKGEQSIVTWFDEHTLTCNIQTVWYDERITNFVSIVLNLSIIKRLKMI